MLLPPVLMPDDPSRYSHAIFLIEVDTRIISVLTIIECLRWYMYKVPHYIYLEYSDVEPCWSRNPYWVWIVKLDISSLNISSLENIIYIFLKYLEDITYENVFIWDSAYVFKKNLGHLHSTTIISLLKITHIWKFKHL